MNMRSILAVNILGKGEDFSELIPFLTFTVSLGTLMRGGQTCVVFLPNV